MENARQILDKISADPAYQELTALKEIPELAPSASGGSQSSNSTPICGNTQAYIPPDPADTGKQACSAAADEASSSPFSGGIFSKHHPASGADEGPSGADGPSSAHPLPVSTSAVAAAASDDGEKESKKTE